MAHKIKNFSYTNDEGEYHHYEVPIWDEDKEYHITYFSNSGRTFRVILREKKYPIGFNAKW